MLLQTIDSKEYMQIIVAPHPTLRQKSELVTVANKKTEKFLHNLAETLINKRNPSGVDVLKRVFATYLPNKETKKSEIRLFVNPTVVDHSNNLIFGETGRHKKPRYEGCLSLPGLYGPVPRWDWLELEYYALENNELIAKKERFTNFNARVIQHEYDHLEGILFTDYSFQLNLPVYIEDENEDLIEIDKSKLRHL